MSLRTLTRSIWKIYPDTHVSIDVTTAGLDAYCIEITLADENFHPIRIYEYYGHGDLQAVKEEAMQHFVDLITHEAVAA